MISRMSSSVVPGRTRQSSSTVASPGITLYFTPAWTMFGLIVSRRSALMTRAEIGSQVASSDVSPTRGSSLASARIIRAASASTRSATPRRNACMTGVGRGGPWTASRAIAAAARTAALSSRGMEPWPQAPWTVRR